MSEASPRQQSGNRNTQKTPLIQVTQIIHTNDLNDVNDDVTLVPVDGDSRHRFSIPTIGIDNPSFEDDDDIDRINEDHNISFPDDDDHSSAVFSEINDIHTPLPTPMPIHSGNNPNMFVFDPDCTSLYSRRGSYSMDTVTPRPQLPNRAHRGSIGLTLTGSDKSSLTVPTFIQLRTGEQSNGGLKPSNTDSGSDCHIPPPSPGILSTNSAWSELMKVNTSRRGSDAGLSDFSRISNVSSSLSEHLRYLIRAFSSRTEKVKESTLKPPSPSSLSDYANSDALSAISTEPQFRRRLDSFLPDAPDGDTISEIVRIREEEESQHKKKFRVPKWLTKLKFPHVIEPQSKLYLLWLAIVTLAFMYNAWVIPLRTTFPYQTEENLKYWLIVDYVCDFIYVVDILLFKMRITFLNSGLKETHRKSTRANYMKKKMFKFDCLSLLPLDLCYLIEWKVNPWYRLPRILKIQTFWEFHSRCDHLVRSAHAVRIIKTMTYMLFLIHIETCGYYAVSLYQGLNSNEWVYNGEGNAYIRCFYLATKTATSIGNNPKPSNQLEYMFMTVYWMSGVFVFALLIGQIRDIVDAANMVKTTYNKKMDNCLIYGKNLNLPKGLQDRVRTWFVYNWQQQKIIDEKTLMDTLPMKLRKDLAINVHFNTLSKVKLFQDCDKSLLFDLVLKLKPILFLPGDYVCKKGEIGKEMYIVSQGIVEVVGGPNNTLVLATLKEGSVFGEISLLAMATEGGNRRTADVQCKGFTNLFTLSKHDFEAAMKDYPDAHKLLKKRAKKLLRLNARIERKSQCSMEHNRIKAENIIRTPPETPKLVKTVIQVMDPDSTLIRQLRLNSLNDSEKDKKEGQEDEVPTVANTHGSDNRAYDPGSEYNLAGKVPSPEEVERFFDEILAAHENELSEKEARDEGGKGEGSSGEEGDRETGSQKKKTSNSSNSTTDSGVQDTKAGSPVHSTKTISNKDSKESFISTELGDILEGSECSDNEAQPTFDGVNYTADMFGDIEQQTDKTKMAKVEKEIREPVISKLSDGKTELLSFEDNEYAKSFAHGFKITVEAVDDCLDYTGFPSDMSTSQQAREALENSHNKDVHLTGIQDNIENYDEFSRDIETKQVTSETKEKSNKGNVKVGVKRPRESARSTQTANSKSKTVSKPTTGGKSPYSNPTAVQALYRAKTNSVSVSLKSSAKQQKPVNSGKANVNKRATDNNKEPAIVEPAADELDSGTRSISVTEARDCDSVDNVSGSGNQITCFAEVHREKTMSPTLKHCDETTLSPTSASNDPANRQRKISVISIGTVLQDGRETLV